MAAYTTIDDPSAHFQVGLLTGNAGLISLTNDGNSDLKPDMVWHKERGGTQPHTIRDTSRGIDKFVYLLSNVEGTNSYFTSFNTDGYTINSTDNEVNGSGDTYASWQWVANEGTRTTFTESGNNPAGGYQVNTTAGFSIIDYTGTGAAGTIAHGLGKKPEFWTVKRRSAETWHWYTYHGSNTSAPETENLYLTNTDPTADMDTVWNDTAPTSSVFTVGTNGGVNDDADTYVCYMWTSIQGYSKFGVYEGNGSANGPFIYTGFKPAWTLIKCTSNSGEAWAIHDIDRSPVNPMDDVLFASNSNAESANETDRAMDFVSNGIKVRATDSGQNTDGRTYIYAAFAHQPFVTSGGVPCTAR